MKEKVRSSHCWMRQRRNDFSADTETTIRLSHVSSFFHFPFLSFHLWTLPSLNPPHPLLFFAGTGGSCHRASVTRYFARRSLQKTPYGSSFPRPNSAPLSDHRDPIESKPLMEEVIVLVCRREPRNNPTASFPTWLLV